MYYKYIFSTYDLNLVDISGYIAMCLNGLHFVSQRFDPLTLNTFVQVNIQQDEVHLELG